MAAPLFHAETHVVTPTQLAGAMPAPLFHADMHVATLPQLGEAMPPMPAFGSTLPAYGQFIVPFASEPQGQPLRFISASAKGQHPMKRSRGYIFADAVVEAPKMLGICDGVSGVQQLGIDPSLLPNDMLTRCAEVMGRRLNAGKVGYETGDGHWLIRLMQEAFNATTSMGATTVLLVAIDQFRQLVVANIGDCGMLLLRPAAAQPSRLTKGFATEPLRYEPSKPVQVMRLDNVSMEEVHVVIQGARVDVMACQQGDIIVLGSDGIFDNLQEQDIVAIVEQHCIGDMHFNLEHRTPLEEAAKALVDTAILCARPTENGGFIGSPDDTTALVAVVVEGEQRVPDFAVHSRSRRSSPSGGSALFPQCCQVDVDEDCETYEPFEQRRYQQDTGHARKRASSNCVTT